MKARVLIISTVMLLLSVSVHASEYQEMQQAIEAYAPPSYVQSHLRPDSDPLREMPQKDTDFEAEKRRLANLRTHWENALSLEKHENTFVRIDSDRLKKLGNAASDEGLAISVIQGTFSLEDIETLALLRNPRISAEENRVKAAAEGFSQVSNLDEILRQYTAYTEGLMTGIGPMKGKDSVKMKFPFPGVLALKGQVVNQEMKAAQETLEMTRRDVVISVRKTCWNLLFVRQSRKITGETVTLFRELETVANTRYKSGTTSFQDVIKAEIQRAILEEDLHTLREKQRNLESKLLELVNLSPDVRVGHPKMPKSAGKTPPVASLRELALEKRQELRRMRAMIGKTELMIEMGETMILPRYTLNLSLYEDDAIMQVGTAAMKDAFPVSDTASRGKGLPKMPWYGTNDAYLRETRQKLLAFWEDLKKAEAVTGTMIQNAWFELDKAGREAALYSGRIVDLSKSALDVSTRGYESGTVSFADVIASYTNWLRVRLSLARKRSDMGVARAELERIVGRSLK